ncbi:MAG: 4-hydroxy-tetrahydrodipicolinate reductase, partial [Rhodospirillales bacterium]|nr:4-hydroxy-tetrahydrodipicolinate reductase [Rhodospirillales bacterium]
VFHAGLAAETGTALVVGTTGMGPDEIARFSDAATSVCIVQAGNMSVGVNLLSGLVERVSATLGVDFDIEIVEMHHRHKVDAPSGTALMLGEAAARGRGVDLNAVSQRVRNGHTGPRKSGDIGFATVRGGDVVGDHSVIFAGEGERIELTHKAASRAIFANGAIRAALWTKGQAPGLYSMKQVLGLD